MTNDSAFISEVWAFLRPYIGKEERTEVCEGLVEIFDSYNSTEGFEDDVGFEKQLGTAIRNYFGYDGDDDEDDEYDD